MYICIYVYVCKYVYMYIYYLKRNLKTINHHQQQRQQKHISINQSINHALTHSLKQSIKSTLTLSHTQIHTRTLYIYILYITTHIVINLFPYVSVFVYMCTHTYLPSRNRAANKVQHGQIKVLLPELKNLNNLREDVTRDL